MSDIIIDIGSPNIISTVTEVSSNDFNITLQNEPEIWVTVSENGQKGDPGDPSNKITKIASIPLSGHRVVSIDNNNQIYYADKDITNTVLKILGITTNACAALQNVEIQLFGELVEPTWNWNINNPIYLGNNGYLTQTVPTTGNLIQIGFPLTTTKIYLDIKPSILLI